MYSKLKKQETSDEIRPTFNKTSFVKPEQSMMSVARAALGVCTGVANTVRNINNFRDALPEAHELEKIAARVSMMVGQVAMNRSILSIILFVFQIANEFGFTPSILVSQLYTLFTNSNLCPTQLFQDMARSARKLISKAGLGIFGDDEVLREWAESNSEIEQEIHAVQSMIEMTGDNVAALAGVVGGVAILLAGSIAASNDFSCQRGFLKNISEFASKVAKMKNGIYAMIAMVRDFAEFVRSAVLNYYQGGPSASVVRAMESLNLRFDDTAYTAVDLVNDLRDYNTEEGERKMAEDYEHYRRAQFASNTVTRLQSSTVIEEFAIPTQVMSTMSSLERSLSTRLKTAAIRMNVGVTRFEPYVIYLAGNPGVGKSQTMARLVGDLMRQLNKEADKYEVPGPDQWAFAVNFTQKYHTGYNGQYITTIDDLCQDKPGTLETSSCLQFIQWVSSIPANMTQADLADKKCPFRSKIIIATSNSLYPERQQEIVSSEAFQRRRNMLVEVKATSAEDEGLNHGIAFVRRHATNQNAMSTVFGSYYEMAKTCLDEFKKHYEHQQSLMKNIITNEDTGFAAYCASQSFGRTEPQRTWRDTMEEEYGEPLYHYNVSTKELSEEGEILFKSARTLQCDNMSRVREWFQDLTQTERAMLAYSAYQVPIPCATYDDMGLFVPMQESSITVGKFQLDSLFDELYFSEGLYVREWPMTSEDIVRMLGSFAGGAEQSMFAWKQKRVQWSVASAEELCCEVADEQNAVVRFWEHIKPKLTWKILAAIGVVITAGLAGCYAWKTVSWRDYEAEPSYNHEVMRQKPKVAVASAYDVGAMRAKPHITAAVQSNFVTSVHARNLAFLNDGSRTINGVFVQGTALLTCRHFFIGRAAGDSLTLTHSTRDGDREVSFEYDPERVIRVGKCKDAVVYDFGSLIPPKRSLVNHFAEGAVMDHLEATIAVKSPTAVLIQGQVSVLTRTVSYGAGLKADELIELVSSYLMHGSAMMGASGSPLMAGEDTNNVPKIYGIQVAIDRGAKLTFCEPVSKQDLVAALSNIAEQSMLEMESEEESDWEEFAEVKAQAPQQLLDICTKSLIFDGEAEMPVNAPQATNLRRSRVHHTFERDAGLDEFAPAALSSRDGTNVLYKSMAGFNRTYGLLNTSQARQNVLEFITEDRTTRKSKTVKPVLLTDDEILNGNGGQGLKGVELKTSPGLPLIHDMAGCKGKTRWIRMDEQGVRHMDDSMWAEFAAMEAKLKKGKIPRIAAYACLKDELRTVAKVEALKTRSFIILPMIYNLVLRKYFGSWISVQHQKAGTIASCVGVDCNTGWTNLMRRLESKGDKSEDFDYSDWDRSLHPQWFELYAQRVSAWYGDKPGSEGYRVRMGLMQMLAHTRVQVGQWQVLTTGGNKSGCAITAEVNTDVHDMLVYYVYRRVCEERGQKQLATLPQFRERVVLALYGDDVVMTARGDTRDWFNGNVMLPHIERLGMVITPGDKDVSKGFRQRPLSEVTFLKRKFLQLDEDCGLVRAPLDKAVIQRMVLWVHKSDDAVSACHMNVVGALKEAVFWGEEFFNDFENRLRAAWTQAGLDEVCPIDLPSYERTVRAWRDKEDGSVMPGQFQFSSQVLHGQEEEEADF